MADAPDAERIERSAAPKGVRPAAPRSDAPDLEERVAAEVARRRRGPAVARYADQVRTVSTDPLLDPEQRIPDGAR